MPNGGSDCCGTCWFNSKNDGKPGYHGAKKEGAVVCTLREIEIPSPFYTYCANHPHHSWKTQTPIGAVYVHDHKSGGRMFWLPPPDTEANRLELIRTLNGIGNHWKFHYPSPLDVEEETIKQLASLKETRALDGLRRIIHFDLDQYSNNEQEEMPFLRNVLSIVGFAIEALLCITDGEALEEVRDFIYKGIEEGTPENYDEKSDVFAILRYHLTRGMRFANSNLAIELLRIALQDPHSDVRGFAADALASRLNQG